MSADLNSNILKLLKCVSCNTLMNSSIYLCLEAHNVCKSCWMENIKCPLCDCGFMATRNKVLEGIFEGIADFVETPCPNEHLGCKKIIRLSEKQDHLQNCRYLSHTCKLDKDCLWTGCQNEIRHHSFYNHEAQVWVGEDYTGIWRQLDNPHVVNLMIAHGEIFYVHRKLSSSRDLMYWAVQYIGRSEDINLYYYQIEITTNQFANRKITVSEICTDYKEDMSEIINSGFCVAVPYNVLETYIDEDWVVLFKVSILRA